jgi:hypothetical protein
VKKPVASPALTGRQEKPPGLCLPHFSLQAIGMNRDAIGAIAELFGATGIIASLVYLALQVRASTAKIREISSPRSSPQIQ